MSLLSLSYSFPKSSQLSPPSSSESDELQPTKKHKTHKMSSSQCKKTSKAARDTRLDVRDQKEGEYKGEEREGGGSEEAESQHTGGGAAASHHRHKYVGDLSPVQESPEYKTDEINYQELELALSRLNSEISELPGDLMEETQITHTVMVTSTQQQLQPLKEDEDSLFQGISLVESTCLYTQLQETLLTLLKATSQFVLS